MYLASPLRGLLHAEICETIRGVYAFLRALHSRDTQTYRSGLVQHLEAVKIEHAHEDAALQCLSHLCPPIRFRDLDSDEG